MKSLPEDLWWYPSPVQMVGQSLSSCIIFEWTVNIRILRSSDRVSLGIGGIEHRNDRSLSHLDQIQMAFASPIP
jgi:hypothetical protein